MVDAHIPCISCAYDLFGVTLSWCPECGAPLHKSLSRTRLLFAPRRWLRHVRFGLTVNLIGTTIAMATVEVNTRLTGPPGSAIRQAADTTTYASLCVMLAAAAFSLVLLGSASRSLARRVVMYASATGAVLLVTELCARHVWRWLGHPLPMLPLGSIVVLFWADALVQAVFFIACGALVHRVPCRRLALALILLAGDIIVFRVAIILGVAGLTSWSTPSGMVRGLLFWLIPNWGPVILVAATILSVSKVLRQQRLPNTE